MKFITFQPHNWKTSERYNGYHDIYWDELKFNPVWCIPAESLKQAFVNGLLTIPITPERTIFFDCKNYHMIKKIDHYKFIKDEIGNTGRSALLSNIELKEYLKENNLHTNVNKFLFDVAPYDFEYMVNPKDINIISETNISSIINDKFSSPKYKKTMNNVLKQEIEKTKIEFSRRTDLLFWETESRCVRNAIAYLQWRWYIQDNDFFIDDYKRVIGMKKTEKNVSTNNINTHKLDNLLSQFSNNVSKKNFENIIDYLETHMYV